VGTESSESRQDPALTIQVVSWRKKAPGIVEVHGYICWFIGICQHEAKSNPKSKFHVGSPKHTGITVSMKPAMDQEKP